MADQLEHLRIRTWDGLAHKFLEVAAPEHADILFGYLQGLSDGGATVLADSLAVEPLAGDNFEQGILLRYKLGIRKNKYSGSWLEKQECTKAFTVKDLYGT